jgi:hypothetical protein
MTNHLSRKNEKTGSCLKKVRNAVMKGGTIGITFVMIKPSYMRCAVEAWLLEKGIDQKFKLWNKRGRKRSGSVTLSKSVDRDGQIKQKKRPKFKFHKMDIPLGAVLRCNKRDVTVVVVEGNRVRYEDKEMELTPMTNYLLDKNITRPLPYWSCEGKNLMEIYDETYPPRED